MVICKLWVFFRVKAVALSLLKEQPSELDKEYGRLKTKETDETVYYVQEFKVACADKEYSDVLKFLRTDEYKIRNIFLKDIDVRMDYAGSYFFFVFSESLSSSICSIYSAETEQTEQTPFRNLL